MINEKTVFGAADLALPSYGPKDRAWEKWAVIACDQFTSEREYWEEVKSFVGDAPSAYRLILPEAYLGTEEESLHKEKIAGAMKEIGTTLTVYKDSMVYLKRTLPDGRIRRGLVGAIDLEHYDYIKGSRSAVRATEETVIARIPPRVAVRREASYELPHVMLLCEDEDGLFSHLEENCSRYELLYDFTLMQGGGRAAGFRIFGEALDTLSERIAEREHSTPESLLYAVGDGNHSLASARAHYMELKEKLGTAALTHPARYALVELVALQDEALVFEPIYRVVKDCDVADFLSALEKVTEAGEGKQTVTVIAEGGVRRTLRFTAPDHALTVGTLQNFIDAYIKEHPGTSCDYIHDEGSLLSLANRPGCVGFLFDGMGKEELFPYVREHGTLPRKTFSMGEARSKRYYIEARRIVQP